MEYFIIQNFKGCLKVLEEYDACGVNLVSSPSNHFSGNFWWSKSSNVKNIGKYKEYSYNSPEFYITSNPNGKYIGLWISNTDHYCYLYPPHLYIK